MAKVLGALNPIQNAEAWSTVLVAGIASPGVCIVKDWKRSHEWDEKKGRGAKGATLTFVQKPPAKGSIEFLLWEVGHFQEWDDFYPLFAYDPLKPLAVDLFHPSLSAIDITSAVTENIGNVVHQGQGLYSVTIDFIEFLVPPSSSAVGTADGSIGLKGANGNNPEDAEDAYDRKIRELTAEYQKLG